MAVLGFQLVTTLIGASILSKIVTYFTFTRLVYNGLSRFLVPSDELLLEAAGNLRIKNKGRRRRPDAISEPNGHGPSTDVFYFPRTVSIQLQTSPISYCDVGTLPLYSNCQWLLDFTVCALGIYCVTEIVQSCYVPWFGQLLFSQPADKPKSSFLPSVMSVSTRLNLSLVWLSLAVWFTLRTLLSVTSIYFRSSAADVAKSDAYPPPTSSTTSTTTGVSTAARSSTNEWFLILAAGFLSLIMTGFFLALDGRCFEFNLQAAYTNLTWTLAGSSGTPLISWGAFHAILCGTCALVGALLVYPGMKFGRIYIDAVSKRPVVIYKRLLFHLAFIAPLLPILLWMKPVTDHLLRALVALSFHPVVSNQPTLFVIITMAVELFGKHLNTLRLLSCLGVVLSRIVITRWYLQAYLHSAQDKLDQFNREPGQTSNKEVQRLVASIFYCINLVALQWIAPTILLLATVCLYKNIANLSWLPVDLPRGHSAVEPGDVSLAILVGNDSSTLPDFTSVVIGSTLSWAETLSQVRLAFHRFTGAVSLRGMAVSRGVFGFIIWWYLVALQSVSLLGLAYHRFAST